MSMERKETITCPACGNAQDFIVWHSLNGDLNPEAKQQLMDGTLFRFKCSKCGYKSIVNYNTLYHDMTHQAMVYYVGSVKQALEAIADAEKMMSIAMHGYRKRIVTNQNSLREKAIIFEHGLDDRVIEIIKLTYLANISMQFPDAKIKEVYFVVTDGKYILEFIGDSPMSAEIPANMYDRIKNEFADRLEASENEEFVVNTEWALTFLNA